MRPIAFHVEIPAFEVLGVGLASVFINLAAHQYHRAAVREANVADRVVVLAAVAVGRAIELNARWAPAHYVVADRKASLEDAKVERKVVAPGEVERAPRTLNGGDAWRCCRFHCRCRLLREISRAPRLHEATVVGRVLLLTSFAAHQ